jgi:TatD DNase family protein
MQKIVFERHIDLARELNLPLMLHIRPSENKDENGNVNREDVYLDAIEILKNYEKEKIENKDFKLKGNFHFFVSTKNVLEKILKELPDFTISIPAVCTFTNEYDEMIKFCPLNKIHIETDSPYVLPKGRRKEKQKEFDKISDEEKINKSYLKSRNEPNFVTDVFEKVCELKSINTETEKENFRNILKENFNNLYLNN